MNCEHGWASENYVKCPRCYDAARHAEEVAALSARLAAAEADLETLAREARRFYLADGTVLDLDPEEVVRRRKQAAVALAATERRAEEAERLLADLDELAEKRMREHRLAREAAEARLREVLGYGRRLLGVVSGEVRVFENHLTLEAREAFDAAERALRSPGDPE